MLSLTIFMAGILVGIISITQYHLYDDGQDHSQQCYFNDIRCFNYAVEQGYFTDERISRYEATQLRKYMSILHFQDKFRPTMWF